VRSSDMGSTLLRQLVSESRSPTGQGREAVTVDVTQSGNRLTVQADHIEVFFEVEGIDLRLNTDPSGRRLGSIALGNGVRLQLSLQSTHRPASSCECGAAVASLVDVDTRSIPVHQSERPRRKWLFELSILNVPIESVEKRTPKAVLEKPCLGLEKRNDLEVQAIHRDLRHKIVETDIASEPWARAADT
jgi:hypothetical protein